MCSLRAFTAYTCQPIVITHIKPLRTVGHFKPLRTVGQCLRRQDVLTASSTSCSATWPDPVFPWRFSGTGPAAMDHEISQAEKRSAGWENKQEPELTEGRWSPICRAVRPCKWRLTNKTPFCPRHLAGEGIDLNVPPSSCGLLSVDFGISEEKEICGVEMVVMEHEV